MYDGVKQVTCVCEQAGNPAEKIMNKMVNNDVAARSRASKGLRTPSHSAN